jgi:hypothetical protein
VVKQSGFELISRIDFSEKKNKKYLSWLVNIEKCSVLRKKSKKKDKNIDLKRNDRLLSIYEGFYVPD